MYYTVVTLLAVGLAQGHVLPAAHISSQFHAQDELGQYSYGYSGGPSAKHETKTADGVTRGAYSYVDANGLVQSTSYVSDSLNGFRVASTNLPAAPAPALLHAHAPAYISAAPAYISAPTHTVIASSPAVFATGPAVVADAPAPAPVMEASVESDDTTVVESAAPAEPEMNEAPQADSTPAETPMEPAPVAAAPEAPMPVSDTPEVVQARLAHMAAVEEAKTRDAATAARDAALAAAVPIASFPAPIAYGAAPAPVAVAHSAYAVAPAVAHAPVAVAAAPAIVGHVASQYHAQDELGQYSYGYAGGPSAKHETKTVDGITQGGYSYVDANGLVQSAAYVSDPFNGFRVAATNLPVQPEPSYIPDSPEVAEAKAKLFQAQAEHIAKL